MISYALYQVRSKEEAVEWAYRFMRLHRDLWAGWEGEADVLQVFGPEDFAPPACSRMVGSVAVAATDPTRATTARVEAVWRIESGRVIAGLARLVGDVGVAEELAQDALVIALEQWPTRGVPDNPGAWLMATAKHHAVDLRPPAHRLPAQARS